MTPIPVPALVLMLAILGTLVALIFLVEVARRDIHEVTARQREIGVPGSFSMLASIAVFVLLAVTLLAAWTQGGQASSRSHTQCPCVSQAER